jgi:tetratricopeptide (TPR) repeat protein
MGPKRRQPDRNVRQFPRPAPHRAGVLGINARRWAWAGVVALIALAAFSASLACGFIDFDDDVYVLYNPHVRNGLTSDNLAWAFTNVEGASWMPLTWVTLQLDGELAGQPLAAPAGRLPPSLGPPAAAPPSAVSYHLQNMLWHAAAAALLFLLLDRLTARRWASAALAVLWAVHPLRVESVTWVAERKDVLATFWGLVAIGCYLRWRSRRTWPWYAALVAAFCLSLMGKAMLVTLPAVLLLLDVWPLGPRRSWPRAVAEKLPLAAVAAAFTLLAVYAQSQAEAVRGLDQIGLAARLQNAAVSYVRYLWMHADCWSLGVFYPFNAPPPPWQWAGAALLLAALTAACLWQRRARPWFLVGWLWYLVTLLPVIGLVQLGEQSHADRYTYFPTIGLALLLAMAAPAAWWASPVGRPRWPVAAAAGLAALLLGLTLRQTLFWCDTLSLFEHTLAVTDGNYSARYTAAIGRLKRGDAPAAERYLRESVAIRPAFTKGHAFLADLLLKTGRPAEAAHELEIAIHQVPQNPEFHTMLGVAYFQTERYADAARAFEAALRITPGNPQIQQNLAAARARLTPPTTHP